MEVHAIHGLAARRRDDEQGFTLIELMVVVLIIAILIAIAIPTFLGARQRAQDRAAQSDLRNGLTAEKTVYTDAQTYDTDVQIKAAQVETSLKWGAGLTAVVANSSATTTNDVVCLAETSKSGTKFAIADIAAGANAGTYFGKGKDCSDTTVATLSGAFNTGW